MILVDLSSTIHRKVHTAVKNAKPTMLNGKYITKEFIDLVKYYILQDLFELHQLHHKKFGEIVITLDNKSSDGYWREDVYALYKSNRVNAKDESDVIFSEIFAEINILIEEMRKNLPWKVVDVRRAEADDIMLVLAKVMNPNELILIHSPDKDMIQAQRNTDNVYQYSALTQKWLVPENKNDDMSAWIQEHVCLGDKSDGVPKVVDFTEFSDSFLEYMRSKDIHVTTTTRFKSELTIEEKRSLIDNFNVFKLNRKKESTGVLDIYKDMRFGPAALIKAIKENGSLDDWLDTHPSYRPNYDRNFKLVMEEGIPVDIYNEILVNFKEAETKYNKPEFEDYLIKNNLKSISLDLGTIFKSNQKLCAADFGW
jgi:5'-3' exonuclease